MKVENKKIEIEVKDIKFETWQEIKNFDLDIELSEADKQFGKIEISYEVLAQLKNIIKMANEYYTLNKEEDYFEKANEVLDCLVKHEEQAKQYVNSRNDTATIQDICAGAVHEFFTEKEPTTDNSETISITPTPSDKV